MLVLSNTGLCRLVSIQRLMEHIRCDEQKLHLSTGERKIYELFNFYLVILNLKALSGTLVSRSTMLLKYRSKPKFRFNKIYLRPLKNGRISKADDYFWKINRKLKARYRSDPLQSFKFYKTRLRSNNWLINH